MKNISSFFAIAFLILFTNVHLEAQEIQQSDTLSNKGKKAFTFFFNGFYLGGGLGGTFWISNTYALRILLSGSYESNKDLTSGFSSHNTSVGVTAYLEKHFYATRSLSPYIGAGMGVKYTQYNYYYNINTSRNGSVTIPVLAGAEYWFTDNISLSGEQSIGFNLYLNSSTREFIISSSTSSLLLSMYF